MYCINCSFCVSTLSHMQAPIYCSFVLPLAADLGFNVSFSMISFKNFPELMHDSLEDFFALMLADMSKKLPQMPLVMLSALQHLLLQLSSLFEVSLPLAMWLCGWSNLTIDIMSINSPIKTYTSHLFLFYFFVFQISHISLFNTGSYILQSF